MGEFDPKEFEPLGIVLRVPIRRRRALMEGTDQQQPGARKRRPSGDGSGGGRGTIRRLVARAPEVMVKISGGARGAKQLREHLNYITRNGELTAETPHGNLEGREDVAGAAQAWWTNRGESVSRHRANSRETVNMVLSMPPGTDRDKLLAGARLFASRTFAANHDYLLVEHRDTNHPHVHLTVRALGHDLTRLNPKKADLQAWREGLALELRAQGLMAEATPRRARGVVTKHKRQALFHMDRDVRAGNTKRVPRVQRAKIAEAVREITQQVAAGERPWEAATKWRQAQIRKAWGSLARQFDAEGGEGATLAADIRTFVAAMPPVETERDQLRREVAKALPRGPRGGAGGRVTPDRGDRGNDER